MSDWFSWRYLTAAQTRLLFDLFFRFTTLMIIEGYHQAFIQTISRFQSYLINHELNDQLVVKVDGLRCIPFQYFHCNTGVSQGLVVKLLLLTIFIFRNAIEIQGYPETCTKTTLWKRTCCFVIVFVLKYMEQMKNIFYNWIFFYLSNYGFALWPVYSNLLTYVSLNQI